MSLLDAAVSWSCSACPASWSLVARRDAIQKSSQEVQNSGITRVPGSSLLETQQDNQSFRWTQVPGQTCLDEVKEIITLPEFDAHAAKLQQDPETMDLGERVTQQLRSYISTVSTMYRTNEFHSFEHACHVTMSVTKLLSRIVAPSDLNEMHDEKEGDVKKQSQSTGTLKRQNSTEKRLRFHIEASTLHDHTYGITSDPLTQFALVFSALIHDVDHSKKIVKSTVRCVYGNGRLTFCSLPILYFSWGTEYKAGSKPRCTGIKVWRNKTRSIWHGICWKARNIKIFGRVFTQTHLNLTVSDNWLSR